MELEGIRMYSWVLVAGEAVPIPALPGSGCQDLSEQLLG